MEQETGISAEQDLQKNEQQQEEASAATQVEEKPAEEKPAEEKVDEKPEEKVDEKPDEKVDDNKVEAVKPKLGGGGIECLICTKTSFPAETIYFEQKAYHVNCFKCTSCTKKISGGFDAAQYENNIYCQKCFKVGGFSAKQRVVKWVPKSGQQQASSSGGTACTVCQLTVFPAETVSFETKPYHNKCLSCFDCKQQCTVNNVAQFEGSLYCTKCWEKGGYAQKQRNVKWVSKSGSSGAFNPIAAKLGGGGTKCTVCEKTCYPAETVSFETQPYHPNCLACSDCTIRCTVNSVNKYENKLYCAKCWDKGGYSKKQRDVKWEAKAPSSGAFNPIAAKLGGGGMKCTVCEKTCFPAETVSYEQKPYHGGCLNCSECATRCTVNTVNGFENKLYCVKCWDKGGFAKKQREVQWKGPSGVEEATGAFAKMGAGSAPKCFRCSKTVYPAETTQYEGNLFHTNCFKCTSCQIKVTPAQAEHKGPEPYCKKCWNEKELWRA